MVFCKKWLSFSREDKLVEHAKAINVNEGTESDADLGPVISKQVTHILTLDQSVVQVEGVVCFVVDFMPLGCINMSELKHFEFVILGA